MTPTSCNATDGDGTLATRRHLARLWDRVREARLRSAVRVGAFLALAATFVTSALPIAQQTPVHAVHVSGCLTAVSELAQPSSESAAPPRFVTAVQRPRWGLEWTAERFLPLQIDGHIGALPSYPFCSLTAASSIVMARAALIASGCLTLLLILLIGRSLASESAGWIAAAFAATSPHFLVVHGAPIPYEIGSFLFPAAALLLLLRAAPAISTRQWTVAAFCLGIGVASKQTAVWAAAAILGGAVWAGWRPRPSLGSALRVGVCFLVPLVPQLGYALFGETAALHERFGEVGSGASYLSLERVAFFVERFYDCFVRIVAFSNCGMRGASCGSSVRHLLAGAALLLLLTWTLIASVRRRLPVRATSFVVAFWMLVVAHYAFYYQGYWLYELMTPWVPLVIGIAVWSLWTGWRPWAGRAIAVICVLLLAGNQLLETNTLDLLWAHGAPSSPSMQQAVASELLERERSPWIVSSAQRGVFETISGHELTPRYLDDLFFDVLNGELSPRSFDAAWSSAIDRMGPGGHTVVVPSHLGAFDVRDDRYAQLLLEGLATAARERGGEVEAERSFTSDDARVLLRLVSVRLPDVSRRSSAGTAND